MIDSVFLCKFSLYNIAVMIIFKYLPKSVEKVRGLCYNAL